jgi:hypothetical protein
MPTMFNLELGDWQRRIAGKPTTPRLAVAAD